MNVLVDDALRARDAIGPTGARATFDSARLAVTYISITFGGTRGAPPRLLITAASPATTHQRMNRGENNRHRRARQNPSRPGSTRRPPTTHPRSVRRRLLLELAVEGVSAKVGVVLHQLQALGGVAAVLRFWSKDGERGEGEVSSRSGGVEGGGDGVRASDASRMRRRGAGHGPRRAWGRVRGAPVPRGALARETTKAPSDRVSRENASLSAPGTPRDDARDDASGSTDAARTFWDM